MATHPPVFYIGDNHSGGINIGYFPQEIVIAEGVPSDLANEIVGHMEELILEAQEAGAGEPDKQLQPGGKQ